MTRLSTRGLLCITAIVAGSALTAQADDIVYQDHFDGDGIDVNAGIGGGLEAYERQGGPWLDDGSVTGLDSNRNGNNDRANLYSTSAFDLTGGFKLEVTYTTTDLDNGGSNRINIGLIDALPAVQNNTTYVTDFLDRNVVAAAGHYGIGLALTTQDATQGFNFSDGTALAQLSNAQAIAIGTQTAVIEVDANSNWSYSIDGATATTGTLAQSFDFARDFHFFTYVQDNTNNLVIESVTLTVFGGAAIPGDTDGDGDVDDADLGTSFSNYTGPVGAAGGKTAADGDTDGDGDVDDSDLGTSFSGYTGPLGPAAVPEPTSIALLGLGGLLAFRRRR